ncbi:formimidoylglutamase [Maribacter algarum]|uniref:Formimidoylglutamase n=1 Tax=Maribacter algarum (ex Zhang et al. 2020) TaxID=2578118 RepID=A0A5S3PTT4_9FLAO|nr:formimidoylglutamase [Maribacter algarum]TMM58383.1 formimidoylglutamase [Maribacter algarum]
MNRYLETNPEFWSGRKSGKKLYLHEKVQCINIERESLPKKSKKSFTLLSYACDEGVKRNQGRVGAFDGPQAIRKALAKLPNHLEKSTSLVDAGTLECIDGKLENIQTHLAEKVVQLLQQDSFPVLLGGGHDIAYGHYNGIKNHLENNETIGIINFDAHFDLRTNKNGNNSGTPFFQIAEDCKKDSTPFNYLCLGIRKDANDKTLFKMASDLGVSYIENNTFKTHYAKQVVQVVLDFIREVDHIYVTIDLDGFSSAYASGVSAPSPMGFSPDIVLETMQMIIDSKKLISLDIAEMNPKYDRDHQTAKLAASLIHFVIHQI